MNLEKFRNERREPRTEKITIKALAPYFEGDPVITVRSLSAAELGRAKEAGQRQRDTAELASALIGGDSKDKGNALRQLTEGPAIPDDVAARIEMLAAGAVEPKLEHSDAVLISEDLPTEFYKLTNSILKLTGEGRQLGKPNASGKTRKSAPQ